MLSVGGLNRHLLLKVESQRFKWIHCIKKKRESMTYETYFSLNIVLLQTNYERRP